VLGTRIKVVSSPQATSGQNRASAATSAFTGWKDIFWRAYQRTQEDRVLAVAAGVVFYMLLALFPALAALVSLYGLFTDPTLINAHLSLLEGVLPASTVGIIREQVTRLSETSRGALGIGFLASFAFALWSANAGTKALIDALNVVYHEQEKRSFIGITLAAFAFTIGGLVFFILALGAIVVVPLVFSWLGLESWTALAWLRWPALLLAVALWLAVLYRYAPSRREPRWQWVSLGSILAVVGWIVVSVLFSWYLSNFANYQATYGSLGGMIGLMMWLWLTVIMVLVGGELNAAMEQQQER
jgi:membrane protein